MMLSKSKIKFIRSLKLRKYREKYENVVVEGAKLVGELLSAPEITVNFVAGEQGWIDAHRDALERSGAEIAVTTGDELQKISAFKSPPTVLAVVTPDPAEPPPDALARGLCLYLDGIRDPGNVGTILRIADWFGYRDVFISEDTVDVYNPKVIQASMGSVFRIRKATVDLAALPGVAEHPVFLAMLDGEDITSVGNPGRGVVVFGNESEGVRTGLQQLSHTAISIPARYNLGADSLNVAVAAGIICAHFKLYAKEG